MMWEKYFSRPNLGRREARDEEAYAAPLGPQQVMKFPALAGWPRDHAW
jgi:hypothetical protein